MDSQRLIQQQLQLSPVHSFQEDDQENCSLKDSYSYKDSDSSFSIPEQENICKKILTQSSKEQEISKRKGGKHGLKYAKISNDQREGLIKQVTSTGCTIKSAAQQLGINFSTAKAIMQIFKKEGRSCKHASRKNNKRQSQMQKRHYAVTKDQSNLEEKEQQRQTDEIVKKMILSIQNKNLIYQNNVIFFILNLIQVYSDNKNIFYPFEFELKIIITYKEYICTKAQFSYCEEKRKNKCSILANYAGQLNQLANSYRQSAFNFRRLKNKFSINILYPIQQPNNH